MHLTYLSQVWKSTERKPFWRGGGERGPAGQGCLCLLSISETIMKEPTNKMDDAFAACLNFVASAEGHTRLDAAEV